MTSRDGYRRDRDRAGGITRPATLRTAAVLAPCAPAMPTLPTMTFYARADRPGRVSRVVPVSLPFVACIANEPHYQPPPARENEMPGERRAPNLARLVDRALGRARARSRAWFKADDLAFERTMRRIGEIGR
jgi:hypothetical protein